MQNPLESYRRTQRELRRAFDGFTRANCPTCPTPCCRRPARILPTDILLAEATGWRGQLSATPNENAPDIVGEIAGRMASALYKAPETAEAEPGAEPCEYLAPTGCTFPQDLRPFGCTAYICRYMHAGMERGELARVKHLARDLEEKHTLLLRTVRNLAWEDKEDTG